MRRGTRLQGRSADTAIERALVELQRRFLVCKVGITGRSIAPQLYIGVGLSGKFNHMVGVRAAGTVLAVNNDPEAPIWEHADVGIVGEWHDVLPLLTARLAEAIT